MVRIVDLAVLWLKIPQLRNTPVGVQTPRNMEMSVWLYSFIHGWAVSVQLQPPLPPMHTGVCPVPPAPIHTYTPTSLWPHLALTGPGQWLGAE